MKLKTIELSGLALRWATMKACKLNLKFKNGQFIAGTRISGNTELDIPYEPDIDWDQGGPLIDAHNISIIRGCDTLSHEHDWCAQCGRNQATTTTEHAQHDAMFQFYVNELCPGPTALTAALRCLIMSKMGSQVDVPEEFLGALACK